MGGRKPAKIEKIIGEKNQKLRKDINQLKLSIEKKNPKEIVDDTIQIVIDSTNVMDDLSLSLLFYEIISEVDIDYLKTKREIQTNISNWWIDYKGKNDIITSKEFDRILIKTIIKYKIGGEDQ